MKIKMRSQFPQPTAAKIKPAVSVSVEGQTCHASASVKVTRKVDNDFISVEASFGISGASVSEKDSLTQTVQKKVLHDLELMVKCVEQEVLLDDKG